MHLESMANNYTVERAKSYQELIFHGLRTPDINQELTKFSKSIKPVQKPDHRNYLTNDGLNVGSKSDWVEER